MTQETQAEGRDITHARKTHLAAEGHSFGKSAERAFASIAAWQFASFLLLLLLVWANEFLSLSARVFAIEPQPYDYLRCAILSAFVILTAILTVGHSYVQQKRILSGLITVCSQCHRVKLKPDVWQQIEVYVASQSNATFSHGLCPACYLEQVNKLDRLHAIPAPPPTGSNC